MKEIKNGGHDPHIKQQTQVIYVFDRTRGVEILMVSDCDSVQTPAGALLSPLTVAKQQGLGPFR